MIKKIPIVGPIWKRLFYKPKTFPGPEQYWIQRCNAGKDSGAGSCDKLAEFKAEIINDFVRDNNIATIIEYGCGDGSQLKLAEYPSYIGFDISPEAIQLCQDIFSMLQPRVSG